MTTWSEAFAAQARSDLDVYDLLTSSTMPISQRLHYLQMWLEKICKAHTPDEEFRKTHNVIAKVLPVLISHHWRRIGFMQPPNLGLIRQLCREIDLLHPQVDDNDRRRDNVEYPWRGSSDAIEVPAQWKFPLVRKLYTEPGRALLKAAVSLTRDPNQFIG